MVQTKQSKRRILIIGSDVLMKKLSIKAEWKSDLIRYAFELLKNPLWKRNYDIFGIDEHIHVLDSIKERHAGTIFSEIDLPLLESASFDLGDHDFEVITSGKFLSKFENSKALLIQVFSIASLLDGMANTGMVELGEVQLATYLAEKTFTGQPSFQNGLPSLIAFPSGCNTANCLIRSFGAQVTSRQVASFPQLDRRVIFALLAVYYDSGHWEGCIIGVAGVGQGGTVTAGRQLHDLDDPDVLAFNP
ncbi:hypothetical protein TEA_003412 [Camellia sinensis var. sinensis]|uniref:Uncharacterized protein n=1 Tax=Camellia sinensis var. sinensis TaxID=542762 RepID=A0A4S4E7W0_CAMSN|nr:hypothetical protein TEA_003412 [Camellia sinensis var. sinensis]